MRAAVGRGHRDQDFAALIVEVAADAGLVLEPETQTDDHHDDPVTTVAAVPRGQLIGGQALVHDAGLPLTVSVVPHAGNVERIPAVAALAARLGADASRPSTSSPTTAPAGPSRA